MAKVIFLMEILKLKPQSRLVDRKRETILKMCYLSYDMINLQQKAYTLPQPLALLTSRCKHLPCLGFPFFSRTIYLGNFYLAQCTV